METGKAYVQAVTSVMHYKYSNQGYFCSFFKKISACLVSPTGLEHEGLNI